MNSSAKGFAGKCRRHRIVDVFFALLAVGSPVFFIGCDRGNPSGSPVSSSERPAETVPTAAQATETDADRLHVEALAVDVDSISPALADAITKEKLSHTGLSKTAVTVSVSCKEKIGKNCENRTVKDAAYRTAAYILLAPSPYCGDRARLGTLQRTDDAVYYCYTVGVDNKTWTYLRDTRTGKKGWVRDDLLRYKGSHCFEWNGGCQCVTANPSVQ
jgi:hypothetical protein